jgi:Sec-independent protein translocase protein TatA
MILITVNLASNWVYLIGFELAIVLLIVSLVLFAHTRSLRRLIRALEAKVVELRESMRKKSLLFDVLKGEVEALRHQVLHGYSDALEQQLDATRNRHASLSPDRDIVLDITADTPLDRQTLALRHAFLIAEKEAALAADGKGVDWEVLQAKLAQIIQFYGAPELPRDDGVLDEGFELDAPFEIDTDSAGMPDVPAGVGKIVIANQEEIQRLRNMAVDQHKLIVELKRQLAGADAEEDRERLFAEMQSQLERSERYLTESDNCVRQLEAEIGRLMQDNEDLQQRAKAGGADPKLAEELGMARNLIASFTEQSRDMLSAIAVLEEDNRKLAESTGGGDGGRAAELTAKLDKAQQDLLNLQTQYIELEERYLEAKARVE